MGREEHAGESGAPEKGARRRKEREKGTRRGKEHAGERGALGKSGTLEKAARWRKQRGLEKENHLVSKVIPFSHTVMS